MITRESFLKLAGKTETVALPDGESVLIRELSAGDYRKFVSLDDGCDQYGRLLVASICDEAGALLYGPDDVAVLNALPMSVVRPVWNAALKLNKLMADEAEVEAEDAKN